MPGGRAVGGPLDEHQQHHVEEQQREEKDLRDELHVYRDAALEVPGADRDTCQCRLALYTAQYGTAGRVVAWYVYIIKWRWMSLN